MKVVTLSAFLLHHHHHHHKSDFTKRSRVFCTCQNRKVSSLLRILPSERIAVREGRRKEHEWVRLSRRSSLEYTGPFETCNYHRKFLGGKEMDAAAVMLHKQ